LYHQQRGITEPVAAQDHQNPRRLPQRRSRTEVAVFGLAPSGEEVDHADSSLARGAEPLYDFVAGPHAPPRKGGITNHRLLHLWAREEALPLPSRTHPQTQKQTSAVYTEELTDLNGEVINEKKSPPSHITVHDGSVMLMPKEEPYLLRNVGKENLE